MTNTEFAASIKTGTVLFAAGNMYKVERAVEYSEKYGFTIAGYKMIKSKGTFSGSNNLHSVGHGRPEIVA